MYNKEGNKARIPTKKYCNKKREEGEEYEMEVCGVVDIFMYKDPQNSEMAFLLSSS